MLTVKELRLFVRRIALETKKLATDELIGTYPSVFKGRGMEFNEVRKYEPGDDPRSIDWNVTARMNNLFVKSFKEEREITIMLVVDVSASSLFGSQGKPKAVVMAELAATLAFSAIANQDKVGLLLFSDEVEKFLPARHGQSHVLRIIRELLTFHPKGHKTNLKGALSYLQKTVRSGAICIVISDFLFDADYGRQARLAAQCYDMIAIRIQDPAEKVFPDLGFVRLRDLETGKIFLVDSGEIAAQNAYKEQYRKAVESHKKIFHKSSIALMDIATDKPYIPVLQKFFKMRKRAR
jgi:uncharacterized protein (DUF58 family)